MNKWEKEYAALDIQFDLINEENKRLKEENNMLKSRIDDLISDNERLKEIAKYLKTWIDTYKEVERRNKHGWG